MPYPMQSPTVHVETLDDELCIYDWQRKQVHALNPTAAMVWQLCDGQTSPAQMAAHLRAHLDPALDVSQAEELVRVSVERLRQPHLLVEPVEMTQPAGRKSVARRQALKMLGGAAAGAALLPLIRSIVAPGPVAAHPQDPRRIAGRPGRG